jgi:hypothetical protein
MATNVASKSSRVPINRDRGLADSGSPFDRGCRAHGGRSADFGVTRSARRLGPPIDGGARGNPGTSTFIDRRTSADLSCSSVEPIPLLAILACQSMGSHRAR